MKDLSNLIFLHRACKAWNSYELFGIKNKRLDILIRPFCLLRCRRNFLTIIRQMYKMTFFYTHQDEYEDGACHHLKDVIFHD